MMFRGNNFVGRSDARSVCGRAGPLRVASVVALLLSAACTPTGPSPAPEAKRPSLAQTELVQADGRAQICTAANAAGVGLRGEYFQKAGGKGELLLSRIDPTIDFDANLEWPQDKQTKRPQSIRWSGWIKPPLSGSYRVHVSAPGAKLTLANTEFSGPESADGRMDLAAGRFYSVRIEMDLPTSGTVPRVRLEWTAPHGARYVIPRPLLYQPTETSRSTGS